MPKSSAANRKVPPAQFYLYPEGIWCWKSWKWLCILFGCHCYAKLLGEGISLPKCSVCFRSIPNPEPPGKKPRPGKPGCVSNGFTPGFTPGFTIRAAFKGEFVGCGSITCQVPALLRLSPAVSFGTQFLGSEFPASPKSIPPGKHSSYPSLSGDINTRRYLEDLCGKRLCLSGSARSLLSLGPICIAGTGSCQKTRQEKKKILS